MRTYRREGSAWRPSALEAWHEGEETRIVLIFDIWHPDLSDQEVGGRPVVSTVDLRPICILLFPVGERPKRHLLKTHKDHAASPPAPSPLPTGVVSISWTVCPLRNPDLLWRSASWVLFSGLSYGRNKSEAKRTAATSTALPVNLAPIWKDKSNENFYSLIENTKDILEALSRPNNV